MPVRPSQKHADFSHLRPQSADAPTLVERLAAAHRKVSGEQKPKPGSLAAKLAAAKAKFGLN